QLCIECFIVIFLVVRILLSLSGLVSIGAIIATTPLPLNIRRKIICAANQSSSPINQKPRRDLSFIQPQARRRRSPMKVNWFHLMPYRWLPDDFRERYHGVWVDLPNALYDPERGHTLYNEYLDMLEYADQVGFDAVGVNEHHQNGYGMMPSPNLMAA